MSRICIVGTGYVGLSYAVALADLGHEVVGLDVQKTRVAALARGDCPIYEPGLAALLTRMLASGRLTFTSDYATAVPGAEFVFLCVGTPSLSNGQADLRQVRSATRQIGQNLDPAHPAIIVNKSTLPIGAGDLVTRLLTEHAPPGTAIRVVANPEFLREGQALHDIYHPDRIVVGADDPTVAETVAGLYAPLGAPVVRTDRRTAEMIKYASNAFLVTKISFINEVAQVCERLGADVTVVAKGMGLDPRIGPLFLEAGLGFGGSCFPKDVGALAHMAEGVGIHPQLLKAVQAINSDIRRRFVERAEDLLDGLDGRVIAVWGLAFKQDTDDLRTSPALEIIPMLTERGAQVRAYDPAAMAHAATALPEITLCDSAEAAAIGVDAVLVVTPWAEFRTIDLGQVAQQMRGDLLLDGRNIYDPAAVTAVGLRYAGIGRVTQTPSELAESEAGLAPIELPED